MVDRFRSRGAARGAEGASARRGCELLRELAEEGVPLEELRRAVAEDRLALLPVERVLGGRAATPRPRWRSGRASMPSSCSGSGARSGWPVDPDEGRRSPDRDVEAAKRVEALRDGGDPGGGHARGLARDRDDDVAARGGARAPDRRGVRCARATRARGRAAVRRGAEGLGPLIGQTLAYVFDCTCASRSATTWFGAPRLSAGRRTAADEIAVASPTWSASPSWASAGARGAGRGHRPAGRAGGRRGRAARCGW